MHIPETKNGGKRFLNREGIKDLRIQDLRSTLGSWKLATDICKQGSLVTQ